MTTSQLIQLMQELDPGGARIVVAEVQIFDITGTGPDILKEPVTDAQTMPDRLILVLD